MKQDFFLKIGMVVLTFLLFLNLVAVRSRAAAESRAEESRPIHYKVIRIDASTNEDLLFQKAGEEGAELVGTVQVFGATGYLIFKK
jgi:hypothetical protein